MASIADEYGFFWETLWALPQNAALKAKRKNPNVLMVGDEVKIPPIQLKHENLPTGSRHRFVRKGVPSKFRMRLLTAGRPKAQTPFQCTIDGKVLSGQTDADGILSFVIPPSARRGKLSVFDDDGTMEYDISFGQLDPIEELSGVQQRLTNLGYDCEFTDELDEQTLAALSHFRDDRGLPASDDLDDPTREALLSAHGS